MARKIKGTRFRHGRREIWIFIERKVFGKTKRFWKTEITNLTSSKEIEKRRMSLRSQLQREIKEKLSPKPKAAKIDKNSTLAGYLDKWLREVCEPHLARRTLEDYKYYIKNFLVPFLKATDPFLLLTDLSPLVLHDLFIFMQNQGKHYAVQKMKQILSSACANAVRWELLTFNPAAFARIDVPEQRPRKILSEHDARIFLEFCDNLSVEMCLLTGMRPSECVALRWQDVDFRKNEIRVNQSLVRKRGGSFEFKKPKSKKSIRTISISDKLIQKLNAHRKTQNDMIADRKSKNLSFENLDLVFCSRFGTPLHIHNLNERELKRILKLAGISEDYSLYSLRHSIASLLLADGANIKDVQELLGHATAAFTLNRYIHSIPNARAELTKRFSRIIDEENIIPASEIIEIEIEGQSN